MSDPSPTRRDPDASATKPSFHSLALGILSGRWPPAGSASGLIDSYEVWAYRHDSVATVIVCHFDEGTALAAAAFAPFEVAETQRYLGAFDALVSTKSKLPQKKDGSLGQLSDLELLDVPAAFERLGRALGLATRNGGVQLDMEILGQPTEELLDELGYIAGWTHLSPVDPDAAIFEDIATHMLEEGSEIWWTRARERNGSARIEVLQHATITDATVLVNIPGNDLREAVTVTAYLPGSVTDAEHAQLLKDLDTLIHDRDLRGREPKPMPATGPFLQIDHARAPDRLRAAVKAIAAGQGCTHALLTAGEWHEPTKH